MEGQSQYDLTALKPEQLEELQEQMEDEKEDEVEDQFDINQEVIDAYGSPQPEERQNQHSFLHKAAFDSNDTVRTTFLHEGELGRPLFTVRFMLDMEDVAHHYLDPVIRVLGIKHNGIANYFNAKIQNVTHSGQSNKGFSMNLNVTQKRDMTRKRVRLRQGNEMSKGSKPEVQT